MEELNLDKLNLDDAENTEDMNVLEDEESAESAPLSAFEELKREQEALMFSPASIGYYIGHMILFNIPVIGWIICGISSFTQRNISKRNFARATFICILVCILLTCAAGFAAFKFVESKVNSFVEDFLELDKDQMGIIKDQIGAVGDALDEIQSGKHDDLIDRIDKGEFGEIPEISDLLTGVKNDGLASLVQLIKDGDAKTIMENYLAGKYDDLIQQMMNGELGDMGAVLELYNTLVENEDEIRAIIDQKLNEEQKQKLAKLMEEYEELGFERVAQKYINGDYDEVIEQIFGGKYGDVDAALDTLSMMLSGDYDVAAFVEAWILAQSRGNR